MMDRDPKARCPNSVEIEEIRVEIKYCMIRQVRKERRQ